MIDMNKEKALQILKNPKEYSFSEKMAAINFLANNGMRKPNG
jgi:hypothetical protein